MKLLQTVQDNFRLLSVHPPPKAQDSPLNPRNLLVIFILFIGIAVSELFGTNDGKFATDFGIAFYAIATNFSILVYFISTLWNIENISKLIEDVEGFISARSNITSKLLYSKTNSKIEKFTSIYFKLVRYSVPGMMLPLVSITLVNYFIFNMKEESYFLPFPILLPFSWKTPLGYFIALMIQSSVGFCISIFCSSTIAFFVGLTWILSSIIEDISNDWHLLNLEKSYQNQNPIKKQFCDILKIHSEAKQMTTDFNNIERIITTGLFLWNLATVSSSLLALNSEISKDVLDPIALITPMSFVFWSIVLIAAFCEMGEMVTTEFRMFNDEIWKCDWYLFPIEIQRMLVTVIANTKEPTIIRGYGKALCTRESFKETINLGFSYFMLLHQIDG